MKNLRKLYIIFEYLHNKKVTSQPLYRLDTTEILTELKKAINKRTSIYPITKQQVQMMRHHLLTDKGLFYYKEGIEVPFQIDTTEYVRVCDEILADMENAPYDEYDEYDGDDPNE